MRASGIICTDTQIVLDENLTERVVPKPIDPVALADARATTLPDDLLTVIVEAFEALADPTRAKILYALVKRPLCVRDLALLVGVSESAVSHQMRFLRERLLVTSRRQGTTIFYSVQDQHVAAFFREAEYHADHVLSRLPDHPYMLP